MGVSSRGTPVWLHKEVARCEVKLGPGVVSDETVESNHCAFVPSPQTHDGLHHACDGPLAVGLGLEGLAYGLLRTTDDFREGGEAFFEKRTPQFKGK